MKFLFITIFLFTSLAHGISKTVEASKIDGSFVYRNYVKNGTFDNSITKDITYSASGAGFASKLNNSGGVSGKYLYMECANSVGQVTCTYTATFALETLDKRDENGTCRIEWYEKGISYGTPSYIEYVLDGVTYTKNFYNGSNFDAASVDFLDVPCGTTSSTRTLKAYVLTTIASATSFIQLDEIYFGHPRETIDYSVISDFTTYTPTITHNSGGITNATVTGKYKRIGDTLRGNATITFSAASAAFSGIKISIPTNLTIDTAKMSSAGGDGKIGTAYINDTGVNFYVGTVKYNNTTSVVLYMQSVSGTATYSTDVTNTAPITFGAGDTISIEYEVPISGWSVNQSVTRSSCLQDGSCVNEFSARISSTGVVTGENLDWINGNCTVASGSETQCTFKSGLFSAAPNCQITPGAGSSSSTFVATEVRTLTSSVLYYGTGNTADFSFDVYVTCQRGSGDYKPSSPAPQYVGSVTNSNVTNPFRFEAASLVCSTASTITNTTSGTWTIGNYSGTTSSATCAVTFNKNFNTTPICNFTAVNWGNAISQIISPSTTGVTVECVSTGANCTSGGALAGHLTCYGY